MDPRTQFGQVDLGVFDMATGLEREKKPKDRGGLKRMSSTV